MLARSDFHGFRFFRVILRRCSGWCSHSKRRACCSRLVLFRNKVFALSTLAWSVLPKRRSILTENSGRQSVGKTRLGGCVFVEFPRSPSECSDFLKNDSIWFNAPPMPCKRLAQCRFFGKSIQKNDRSVATRHLRRCVVLNSWFAFLQYASFESSLARWVWGIKSENE